MSKREQALAYFVSMGWTPAQAAGIVANLEAESGLRPDAVGDHGSAFGLAQWHPDRQTNFAAVIGKDIRGSTFEEQLAFVHAELNNFEKAAGDALRATTTAAEAGAVVSRRYERPADAEGEAQKRARLAETIATAASVPAVPTPQPTPTGGTVDPLTLAAIFGPIISQLIPQVGVLFGGKKEAAAAQAIGTVLNTIVQAHSGDPTKTADVASVGAAVQDMQTDKNLQKEIQKAVVTQPEIMAALQITEVAGGAKAAREQDLRVMVAEQPFWKSSAVFWISLLLLPMVYWFIGSMIVGGTSLPDDTPSWVRLALALFGNEWTGEARSGGFNLVVGLVLGGICGVYYGVSVTQSKQQQSAVSVERGTGTGSGG